MVLFAHADWLAQRWLAKYYLPPRSRRKTKWLPVSNKVTLTQVKLLFGPLVLQLVWYILKQLFTSTSVSKLLNMTCLPCEVSCLPRYSQQHKRCNNGKGRPNHLDLQSKACSSHCFESKLEWIDLEGASRRYNGLFPFEQKFRKISKWGQMVRKFPGKVSVKSGNYWISEKRTIQPMIGVESNGTEILGKKFPKISLHLACNCNFIRHRKFLEIQTVCDTQNQRNECM